MIERHHLQILLEIEKRGSLTAAAQSMCLTQSAISHTIRKLENQVDTPLWLKEGRNIRFTPAGSYLVSLAKRILPQLEQADTLLDQYAKGIKGTLRIGIECHPCHQWLIKIVAPFLQRWPDVDLDIKQEFQFGGVAALLNHDIDLLITPDPIEQENLLYIPVFDYEQVLIVSSKHRLHQLTYVTPEHLSHETLFTYPVPIERLDIFRQFLLPQNRLPARHQTIESSEILIQLVIAGRGVSALPEWFVADSIKNNQLTALRLGKTGIYKSLYLGIRQKDHTTPYLDSFISMATEA